MSFNHVCRWLRKKGVWALSAAVIVMTLVPGHVMAADNDFNIQVSPSPVTVTLQPGKAGSSTLTIRNFSNHQETLYPKLNGFRIDGTSKNIQLTDDIPSGLGQWVTFKQQSLRIAPGGSQNLEVLYNTPPNVGFSYAIAVTLTRSPDANVVGQGVQLKGAVAVFTLINIDRPDARRALTIESFRGDKGQYQYLPATFHLTVKNAGNVIDQPKGTIFIQRSFDDAEPITTLPINQGNGYLLPDTSRSFTADWRNGFPAYTTDEKGDRHLSWDWRHISDLRFGKYVAKVVLVYNDGQRDVPLVASYTFWVIPWTLIGILLLVLVVVVMGIVGWGKLIFKGTKKVRGYAKHRS
jgi:hypothetical protein